MRRHRGSLQALLLAGLMLSATASADARSRACDRLEASLTALSRARVDPALDDRYDHAIAAQIEQLRRAGATARRSGCAGLLSIFGSSGNGRCRDLDGTIAHMKRNLSTLRERRGILASRRSVQAEKRRIGRALEAQGCNDGAARTVTVAARPSQIGKAAGAFDQTSGMASSSIDRAPLTATESQAESPRRTTHRNSRLFRRGPTARSASGRATASIFRFPMRRRRKTSRRTKGYARRAARAPTLVSIITAPRDRKRRTCCR